MTEIDVQTSTRWLARSAIAAAVRTELIVMEAVDTVAATRPGSSVEDVLAELERELARRHVSDRSVRGPALLVLADEVRLRGHRSTG